MGFVAGTFRVLAVAAGLTIAFCMFVGLFPAAPSFQNPAVLTQPYLLSILTACWLAVPGTFMLAGLWPRTWALVMAYLVSLLAVIAVVDPAALDFIINWAL